MQDLAIALERGDAAFVEASTTDDVQWELVGDETLEGKAQLCQRVSSTRTSASSLEIDRVLTHGRSGAVNGNLFGPGKARRSFCHVFEFSNTKGVAVRRITSYLVDC